MVFSCRIRAVTGSSFPAESQFLPLSYLINLIWPIIMVELRRVNLIWWVQLPGTIGEIMIDLLSMCMRGCL